MRIGCGRLAVSVMTGSIIAASGAHAQSSERLPARFPSIATISPEQAVSGPLFRRVMEAFAAANQGDGAGFDRFLTRSPKLQLTWLADSDWRNAPFTARTIQAASKSCLGPYPFDEGASWVQLSWVCRVDSESPLASMLTFRDSPELSLTVWFDGVLIKQIEASEPFAIPGRQVLVMDSYAIMKGEQ